MDRTQIKRWLWCAPVLLLLVMVWCSAVSNHLTEPASAVSTSVISGSIRQNTIDKLTPQIRLMLLHAEEGEEVEIDHPGHSPNRMLRTPRKKSCYFGNYYSTTIKEEVREQIFARIFKQHIIEQYLLPSWYHILFRFTPF